MSHHPLHWTSEFRLNIFRSRNVGSLQKTRSETQRPEIDQETVADGYWLHILSSRFLGYNRAGRSASHAAIDNA